MLTLSRDYFSLEKKFWLFVGCFCFAKIQTSKMKRKHRWNSHNFLSSRLGQIIWKRLIKKRSVFSSNEIQCGIQCGLNSGRSNIDPVAAAAAGNHARFNEHMNRGRWFCDGSGGGGGGGPKLMRCIEKFPVSGERENKFIGIVHIFFIFFSSSFFPCFEFWHFFLFFSQI